MSGMFLNFIEYELTGNTINLFKLPFSSYPTKESFIQLRDTYQNLSFHRQDDSIYYWNKSSDGQNELNGTPVEIHIDDNPRLVSKIVETGLINVLFNLGNYKVFKDSHSHTWDMVSQKDALNGKIDGLVINRRLSISPVFFRLNNSLRFGFTFSTNLKYKFLWDLSQFRLHGIDSSKLRIAEDRSTVIPDSTTLYHFLGATGQQAIFDQETTQLEKTTQTFNIIKETVGWLERNKNKILLPGEISMSKLSFKYLPIDSIRPESFYPPKRYFYGGVTNTKGIRFYNEMIKEYKPSSYGQFEEKDTQIAVVFPAEYEGITEVFIKSIEKSLREELHLKRLTIKLIKIPSSTLDAYERGIYEDTNLIKNCDLFIIIVTQEHEALPPALSPYHFCKAKLLGDGIPTQDIQVETIKQRVHPLALSNISLNIYAKLGGTAWTIEKEEKKKDELIIGIGSTTAKDGKSILGIAQVFHSDGRYIVGDCSPLSTFENYSQVLEEYLYQTLTNVIDNYIDSNERFRLIFHLFKSAGKDNEILAIDNVTKRLSQFQFDFALAHLGYGHNYRLYNDDGKKPIDRGTFVKIDSRTALVHFVPDSCLPLKVELDKRSRGFTDLFYIAKQVYWFSNLSHRSYKPSKRTVTIMYPSLMAALTEKLSEVPNWNYDRIKFVRDKIWFI